jgi:hypothetical protein
MAKVRENKAVRMLHHIDLAAKLVILMGNTVVQRLTNHPRVVLLDRRWEQGAIRHVLDSDVANVGKHLVGR